MGRSGAILGPIWGDLGPSWGHLGSSWAVLGRILGQLGPSWSSSWAILGHFRAILDHLGSASTLLSQNSRNCKCGRYLRAAKLNPAALRQELQGPSRTPRSVPKPVLNPSKPLPVAPGVDDHRLRHLRSLLLKTAFSPGPCANFAVFRVLRSS